MIGETIQAEPKQALQEAIGWIARAQQGLNHAQVGLVDAQRSLESGTEIAYESDQLTLAAMCRTWEQALQPLIDHVESVRGMLLDLEHETVKIVEKIESDEL